ncbi:hypothetical protein B0T26DRAFT_670018 [Lasiosphaeria miniovina]|uniref:Uncharacterized protein n=1 Tax=Lasiosphaeria miniovina TaxID=1954250 RepID=A0AA40EB94_9PEZI|nr:uncharacterized protein B0T26DRAFT_670018 [Lasiosphaeria miniovina]KAK0733625.1 hypothetical protein B0T26DRAFT_670018 [Lasiosphaeria miniovina]
MRTVRRALPLVLRFARRNSHLLIGGSRRHAPSNFVVLAGGFDFGESVELCDASHAFGSLAAHESVWGPESFWGTRGHGEWVWAKGLSLHAIGYSIDETLFWPTIEENILVLTSPLGSIAGRSLPTYTGLRINSFEASRRLNVSWAWALGTSVSSKKGLLQ